MSPESISVPRNRTNPSNRPNRSNRLLDPLLDLLFLRGQVEHLEQLTPRMRLIRIGGPGVYGLTWRPGQQIRVRAKDPQASDWSGALRTYSIWSYDGEHLELCVLDHGDGPGANWARGLRIGDEVIFRKPEGKFTCVDAAAPYHLFAGEETASVAFGAMLAGLPPAAQVFGAIEVADPQDRLPLPRSAELAWSYRGDAPAAASTSLVAAVRKLDLPEQPGVGYLAGEARTCQAVRDHLVRERGWPRRSVLVKPFWAPGKRGME
jgi:NADPH-dependent ferric siderophore reductase